MLGVGLLYPALYASVVTMLTVLPKSVICCVKKCFEDRILGRFVGQRDVDDDQGNTLLTVAD